MHWQLIVVVVVVAAASLFLVRRAWRTWSKQGCSGGCGCSTKKVNGATFIPADQLKLRS